MYVSTHFIVKETTELGRRFLDAALASLWESQCTDEVVFIDNGCTPLVRETYESWLKKFEGEGLSIKAKVIPEALTFCDLRNTALDMTSPFCEWIVLQDSDEARIPEDWKGLPKILEDVPPSTGSLMTQLLHLMIEPTLIQENYIPKAVVIRYNADVRWTGKVHEEYKIPQKKVIETRLRYLHFGYCRAQWRTFLKWLRYAQLEHGNLDVYKRENAFTEVEGTKVLKTLPWLRDWRTPDGILEDRRAASCKPYTGPIPAFCKELFDVSAAGKWREFLRELDPEGFWESWKAKQVELGSWEATLDWVQTEMEKVGWWTYV